MGELVQDAYVMRDSGGYTVKIPTAPDGPVSDEVVPSSNAALRSMLEKSGTSGRALGIAMGKSPGYVGTSLSKGSDIGTENLARMASIMGYSLVLRKEGHEIQVRPQG